MCVLLITSRSPFHCLTSCVGSSEQLRASAAESEIRVRLQSVPLPPLLMLQARERAAGLPAATQIQPAKARTRAPGRQSATAKGAAPLQERASVVAQRPPAQDPLSLLTVLSPHSHQIKVQFSLPPGEGEGKDDLPPPPPPPPPALPLTCYAECKP
ncbi:unnamed protein product [Pleuronectes platessa]|uniref:Uncharacterized protein n=1 Tax=Pleuronectes platessa TaxID=8262 RepID=A0A9N7VYA7_PLEPL|nr:unnamed protein product [Pleuronectes platessa]